MHVFKCFQVWDGPGCEKPGLAVPEAERERIKDGWEWQNSKELKVHQKT